MPWHPQQVAGWLVLAAFGACSFGVLLPGLGPDLYPVVLFVLGSLFFLHVVSHVAALFIDPADPQLRASRSCGDGDQNVVPELDKNKHAHVIENGKCHLCNIYTSGRRTKHCGSCNKCVEKFDHHCKWLNHCVGARNYVAFIVSVVSAVLACAVIVLVSCAELVLCNADPMRVEQYLVMFSNRTVQANQLFSVTRLPVDRSVFVAIAATQCVLALIATALLLHLCAFHVYISALGITTYEYIRNYRRYPEFDSRNGASSNNGPSAAAAAAKKSSVLSKVHAFACCYGAGGAAATAAAGRRKRPSCGIHSNLNDDSQQNDDGAVMSVETVESYGGGGAVLLQTKDAVTVPAAAAVQNAPPKCRYCLEKNRVQGNAFFVLGKRKGLCCCFQKPEPVFERAAAAVHHVKVPPSPFAVRRNRVIPTTADDHRRLSSIMANEWKPFDATSTALPALSRPADQRAMQKITLKELGQVLAFVEQQQPSLKKQHRRKTGGSLQIKHSKSSSNLSPIHESGLSNPSTPQLKNRCPQTRPCSWLSTSSALHNNNTSKSA